MKDSKKIIKVFTQKEKKATKNIKLREALLDWGSDTYDNKSAVKSTKIRKDGEIAVCNESLTNTLWQLEDRLGNYKEKESKALRIAILLITALEDVNEIDNS